MRKLYFLFKNRHRDATVPLTEARTDRIHGQLNRKAAPHPFGSRIPFSTEHSSRLSYLRDEHGKCCRQNDRKTQHIQRHEKAASRRKVTDHPLPARVKPLILLGRCGPSLLPAPRQFRKLLANGDLYCSFCLGVYPDVCLTR